MSIDDGHPWVATYQRYWETQGYNLDMPDYFRLHAFAVARATPNLHAEFAPGQLTTMMGKPVNGEFQPMASTRLSNVISQAVERKLLHESSGARCLVLPAHAWACGLSGDYKPCATHNGRRSKPRRFFAPTQGHEENLEKRDHVLAGQRVLTSL